MVLHIVSFRQSRRSSSLALYNHWEHHWNKRGTRSVCLQHVSLSQQIIQTGGKITSRTTAAAAFNNWVDVRCCLKCYRGYLWVCSGEWSSMLSSKRVMCVARISLTSYISYGKMLSMMSHTHFPSIIGCYFNVMLVAVSWKDLICPITQCHEHVCIMCVEVAVHSSQFSSSVANCLIGLSTLYPCSECAIIVPCT